MNPLKFFISLFLIVVSFSVVSNQDAVIEPLYGVKILDGKVAIKVKSKGCSTADKFQLIQSANQLTIKRTQADNCRRMPQLVWLTFELPQPNLPLSLQNPIVGFALN